MAQTGRMGMQKRKGAATQRAKAFAYHFMGRLGLPCTYPTSHQRPRIRYRTAPALITLPRSLLPPLPDSPCSSAPDGIVLASAPDH